PEDQAHARASVRVLGLDARHLARDDERLDAGAEPQRDAHAITGIEEERARQEQAFAVGVDERRADVDGLGVYDRRGIVGAGRPVERVRGKEGDVEGNTGTPARSGTGPD